MLKRDRREFEKKFQEATRFIVAAGLRKEAWSLSEIDPKDRNDWQADRLEELMATPACQVDWFNIR